MLMCLTAKVHAHDGPVVAKLNQSVIDTRAEAIEALGRPMDVTKFLFYYYIGATFYPLLEIWPKPVFMD